MENRQNNTALYIIIACLVMLVIILGGYFVFDVTYKNKMANNTSELNNANNTNINTNTNDSNTANDNIDKTMSKEEALKIAKALYENAYNNLNITTSTELYTIPDYSQKAYKVDFSDLKNYFTENGLRSLPVKYIEYNGDYYTFSEDYYMDFVSSINIFGHVDQGIRTLTIVSCTNNEIIATGLFQDTELDSDKKPHNILFVKENGKWLINSFD